ncbi:MAG: Phenylacetic acid catabolic protein, partial [Actinomycetota bacterium]
DVCEKLLREEVYHQMHADSWFRRLTEGNDEGRAIFEKALTEALADASGLFDPADEADLLDRWVQTVTTRFDEAGLNVAFSEAKPAPRDTHSLDFKPLWDDLTRTYREEPAATW